MSDLVTLLASLSAAAYAVLTLLVLRKRWQPAAGNRWVNAGAVAAFAISRLAQQNMPIAACASAVLAIALALISRRSSAGGAVFASLPLAAMLLTIDRAFFSGAVAQDFQNATIALLCAGGPLAIGLLVLWLSRHRRVT